MPASAEVLRPLSLYHRICLRYPYGQLGMDMEVVVAMGLVEHSWRDARTLGSALGATPGLQALSLPPGASDATASDGPGATVRPHVQEACAPLSDSVSKPLLGGALSTVASLPSPLAPLGPLTLLSRPERQELLTTLAGQVFKEQPDVHGGDLIWWSVIKAAGGDGDGGDGTTITVHRAQV